MATRQRNVAYKFWISQLLQGKYVNNQNDDNSSYLDIDNVQVVRVNIIANVIQASKNESYSSIIIDDSSSAMRVKAWQQDASMLSSLNPGDIVLVIGRIREYNNERYILPELAKKLENPNWLLVRMLELLKEHSNNRDIRQSSIDMVQEETIQQTHIKISSNVRQKVISAIDSLNSADGVSIDEITSSSNLPKKDIELAVLELIKDGELYEHKQGKLKLLQ